MTQRPLWLYVLAAGVAWAVVLFIVSTWNPLHLRDATAVGAGFFLGMLAMYIAVHLYRWQ